jgi:hypothetical protein
MYWSRLLPVKDGLAVPLRKLRSLPVTGLLGAPRVEKEAVEPARERAVAVRCLDDATDVPGELI